MVKNTTCVDELAIQNEMNDYAQIRYNTRRLIPQNINDEFDGNLAFIKQSVSENDAEKFVVVTHHLPTFAAIEDRHKGNVLNSAYAPNLAIILPTAESQHGSTDIPITAPT